MARIWPRYSLRGLHIHITWFSLYGIHITCPRGRYYDVTMLWPLLFHGIRADPSWIPINVLTTRIHGDHGSPVNRLILLDFNAIGCIFLSNNSRYIIGPNCRVGIVFRVFNKCLGIRPSVTYGAGDHFTKKRASVQSELAFTFTTCDWLVRKACFQSQLAVFH